MKRISKICFSVFSFSLAFAGLFGLSQISKKAEPVHATDELFTIANHNLVLDPIADSEDGFVGEARLEQTENEYILHLSSFSNNNLYNPGGGNTSFVLRMGFLKKNVRVKLSGNNILNNVSTGIENGYGIYAYGEDSSYDLIFESEDENAPGSLSVNSPSATSWSVGMSAGDQGNIYINNCEVEIDGSVSPAITGIQTPKNIYVENRGRLSVYNDDVNGANGSNTGISCGNFEQSSGVVYLEVGEARGNGTSKGMECNGKLTLNGGSFSANSGSSDDLTIGLSAKNDVEVNGGSFCAEAGHSAKASYSYALKTDNTSYKVSINKGCEMFYLDSEYRACNTEITSALNGFGSYINAVGLDPSPTKIPAGSGTHTFMSIIFLRIMYSVECADVNYNGEAHQPLSITVTDPNTGYTIQYREAGTTAWLDECPSFTNYKKGGYTIEYKIESDQFQYSEVVDSVTFNINKVKSVLQTAPKKVADFRADGKEHALVTAGSVKGGTIMYSVNGGEYSAKIPTIKGAGTYEIKYKVVGDNNHLDIAAQSLGTVSVALSGGAIAGIVIGSVLFALIAGFALVWFVVLKKSWADLVEVFKKIPALFKKK